MFFSVEAKIIRLEFPSNNGPKFGLSQKASECFQLDFNHGLLI